MRGRHPYVAVALTAVLFLSACSDSDDDTSAAADDVATSATSETPDPTTTTEPLDAGEPVPSPGCEATEVPAAGTTDNTMTSGGEERRYQLIIPEGYDGTEPLPLVFGLHALTVPYGIVPGMSGFADMAANYDFIGVAPSGMLDGTTAYWLASDVPDNRDVAYVAELLDQLEADLCVDTSRVFSTGMSNGGQMSSLLACRLPDRITAVAPIAGVEFNPACDDEPTPVMAFHGDADPIVTFDGGGLNANRISDLQWFKGELPEDLPPNPGVYEVLEIWAEHNGCGAEPTEEAVTDTVTRYEWPDCDADTVLYVVHGMGHSWPGRPVPEFEAQFGPGTTDIQATDLMFEFFLGEPGS